MNCKFVTTLFFLVTALTEPAFGQTDGSSTVAKDAGTVQFRINGALNVNPSCDDEKIGGGAGVDVEWRFVPRVGIGLGAGYSSEMAHIETAWRIVEGAYGASKHDQRLSFINVPLRLYVHPTDWLTLDAGLQWSYVADKGSVKGLNRTCWSVPFGVSFGSTYHFFLRYQPRLGNMMENGGNGEVKSSPLSIGFGMRI